MRNQCLDVWCILLPHLFNINTSIEKNKLQFGNMFSCHRMLNTYNVFEDFRFFLTCTKLGMSLIMDFQGMACSLMGNHEEI